MRRRTRLPSRPGFTLVELMVAMALIIFIMYILAEAFAAGAKTFRDLKAVGDMNTRLRTATTTIRRLLAADHFEGHKRLSDYSFWDDGPPKSGFFRIWQDGTGTDEGQDLDTDGNPPVENHSFRTEGTHHLHFTVRYRGNQRGDYFSAQVPPGSPLLSLPQPDSRFQDGSNQFTSSWSEVAIYMQPTGESASDPTTSGTAGKLHTLFLRQRLLAPGIDELDQSQLPIFKPAYSAYSEVSVTRNQPDNRDNTNSKLWFNSPQDVTMPIRRFGPHFWRTFPTETVSGQTYWHEPTMAGVRSPGSPNWLYKPDNQPRVNMLPYPTLADENSGLAGSDVLLTDVLSFDVRVLLDKEAYDKATPAQPERFVSLWEPPLKPYWMYNSTTFKSANKDIARLGLGDIIRVFDTWSQRKDDKYDYSDWLKTRDTETTIPMYQNDNSVTKPIRIRAIQVTIRIWDQRTMQSRQVSVIQDM